MILEKCTTPRVQYHVSSYKNRKDYTAGIPQRTIVSENIVTKQGMNSLNNAYFRATGTISYWYIIPFSTNTTCVNTMTYESPVFTEFVDYEETLRQVWSPAASANEVISSVATPAVITINVGSTTILYGCALVGGPAGVSAKGNTGVSGAIMYSASLFSGGSLSVEDGYLIAIWAAITQS